jgi:lysophospholipase L1-like esterase
MTEHRRAAPDLLLTAGLLAAGLAPAGSLVPWLAALGDDGRNRADLSRQEAGYYETLTDLGRRLDADRDAPPRRGYQRPFTAGPMAVAVDDLREHALTPSFAADTRHGRWTTTARGLRDRDHAWPKAAGSTRLALLGDSIGAGWGVADGAGFEPLLEAALDADARRAGLGPVEVVNFAVPGHAPGQRWEQFVQLDGWACGPDALIYQATPADLGWDERALARLLPRGLAWAAPQYADALRAAGLDPASASDADALRRGLRAAREALVAGVYRTIAAECRRRGVATAYVLIPRVGRTADADARRLLALARAAGFDRVLDLSDAFDGLDPAALAVAPDDHHPNADGHARLAARLHAALAGWPADTEGSRP